LLLGTVQINGSAVSFHIRLADGSDLERLRFISAQARERYRALPGLAHIADAPPLTPSRFMACRVAAAVDDVGKDIMGFAAMRTLDGLVYLDNISVDAGSSERGIGKALLDEVCSHAASLNAPAVTLTTFKEPAWNGPWFRRHGFQTMPSDRLGQGLQGVMDRQGQTLDPATRETLWLLL
jgi:ribosomal protein S18 acetylase RimI-like enzyme